MLEADLRALVRQLQLRQTDLESENKELRQQTTVAGVPSVEGEDAFDAVPVGYFILDRQGNVLKVNRAVVPRRGCRTRRGDQRGGHGSAEVHETPPRNAAATQCRPEGTVRQLRSNLWDGGTFLEE